MAFELRKLRMEAGGITYRVLAQRAGYSVTTLSQAAAGEQLPTLPVVLAYVTACGGDGAEWEERWKQTVEALADTDPDDGSSDGDPPYRGLARFEAADHSLFFGRDQLTADLLDLLRRQRFAALFGPSGSGKSSLLRAGLIPALQQAQDMDVRPAVLRILTPGPRPARTHSRAFNPPEAGLPPDGADAFVIVDQFEEVFTVCQDPAERARFIDMLLAARRPERGVKVLIAVRADFYGRCAEHRGLADALRDANLLAAPMTPAELREAVVKPATAAGLTVERALTSLLVREVVDAPGGLPLLSHVLLETWRRRRGKTLTVAGYEAAGGVEGAVAKTAEHVYGQFTAAQAAAARILLLRLVAPGDGAPDTRRSAEREELQAAGEKETTEVLEALAASRLLTLDHDTVDLAHEALLSAWPRLRGWVEQDRDRLRAQRKLTEAAHAWEELGHDPGALYRGTRLATAQEYFSGPSQGNLTGLEHAYLMASLAAREQEQQAAARTSRRLRGLVAGLSVLLVLAVIAGSIAWQQTLTGNEQRQVALSRQLAAQSAAVLGTDSDLASLLAIGAYRASPTSQALEALFAAADLPLLHRMDHGGRVTALAFSPDGHTLASGGGDRVRLWDTNTGRIRTSPMGQAPPGAVMAFSPDGRTLAVGAEDSTVQLLDTATGDVRARLGTQANGAAVLRFSPDNATVATSGFDREVQLWNTTTGDLLTVLPRQTAQVSTVAFSPNGRTLATGSFDGRTELWDANSGRHERTLPHRNGTVGEVAYSPDGHTLATSSTDRGVELWDTSTGQFRTKPAAHTAPAAVMAFSPDGRTLATAGEDRTVRLWETDTGRLRRNLPGHTGHVIMSLAFTSDGRTLASGGDDHTIRLWNAAAGESRTLLAGDLGRADSMGLSPDGRTLATAGFGGDAAYLWDLTASRRLASLTGHVDNVPSMTFSPDGHTVATSDVDGGVKLWDVFTGHLRTSLHGYTGDAAALAFSPGGRTLATGSTARGVEVWDAATGEHMRSLPGFNGDVNALAFSPDGRILATGGADRTVRLWDPMTGRGRGTLSGHADAVVSTAFSPDGRTLATGGEDGTVRLWDPMTGRGRGILSGHAGAVVSTAFSPDGHILATGAGDGTVRLWDTDTRGNPTVGAMLAKLSGHTDTVLAVAFSPDGRTVVTAGRDQTARSWDLALPTADAAVTRMCRAIGRDLTAQERSAYGPPETPLPAVCAEV
ncbi:nSTAND1 domain-containing NTPase [Streptomyces sp. HUAS TT3]|uniref:nSTAND1 domain-containing NTPase n=1 Tax=Streptomyces sp. HUAS TT3 TaxID=3447510 RepID=UPI003F65958E